LSSLCLLIIGTTIIVLATMYAHNSAIHMANDRIRFIARDRATHVQYELDKAMESLNLLAIIMKKVKDSIEPMRIEREQVNTMLQSILKQNECILGVYTCWLPNAFDGKDKYYANKPGHDKTGRFVPHWYRNSDGIIDVETCKHTDTDKYFFVHKEIKQSLVKDPSILKIGGKDQMIISLMMPIVLKERHYGIVGVDLKVDMLQPLTEEIAIKEKGGRITILNANRKIIGTTGRQNLAGEDASKIVEKMDQYIEEIAYGKEFKRTLNGEIMFFAPIKTTNPKPWWVIVSMAKAEVTTEARTLSKLLIFAGGGGIILSILFFWLFSDSIVKPLKILVRSVKKIGRGDYGHLVESVSSSDEIGELATAFNNMSIDIKKKEFERNRSEEALKQSEKRFRTIFDNAGDAIVIHDFDGGFIDVNRELYERLGYSKEELMQLTLMDIDTPKNADLVSERIEELLRQGSCSFLTYHVRRDGTTIPSEVSSRIIELSGKQVVLSIARDISKRKRAEKALKKSEEKYRSIFENAVEGFFQSIPEGRFISVNPAFAKMLGYASPEELISCISDIAEQYYVNTEDRLRYRQLLEKDGSVKHFEFKVRCKDGSQIWVSNSTRAIYDPSGKLDRYEGNVNNITLRKLAEEALKENEEKYRSMMEAMKDAVYICSPDFRVEYMNPAMIKRIGRDATGEYCFKSLHDLDERCPGCRHNIVQLNMFCESDIVSPKDNRFYHVSHSPIVHEDGSISKMTVYRDTTDFKKMETQLQQAQKMEAIGTLAGGIAHDFNNILFPISGYTEMLLLDAPIDSSLYHSLREILAGTKRAWELVTQILTFSRQKEHELKPLKVVVVVKEALKLIRSSLPTTIEIRQNVNKDCGLVMADPTQIHQVVMNLCTNAYHAMELTGGKLAITLKEVELSAEDLKDPAMIPGPYVCLTVADAGPGMKQSIIDRIFDPYFTTKEEGKGTGLGLAVVHGIVKSHGGQINVNSDPGKGTEFIIYLPVIQTQAETAEEKAPLPIEKGNESVLLVDDREEIVSLAKSMLYKLGYHVTARTSSIEALEAFRANPYNFDFVITDLTMPNMTGDKLAQKLMAIRPDIPIILCTGFSEKMSDKKAEDLGFKGFLMKPIVMNDLAKTIREVLEENQ
jgi:PAS domain S-box-containing protein